MSLRAAAWDGTATSRRFLLLLPVLATAGAGAPEPSGYRMKDYRAPTPATLAGGRVLTTAAARALWQDHAAVFIDVLPQPPRPTGLPAGTIWRPQPRFDIPGSIWLPDVGYGALAPVMQDWFVHELAPRRDKLLVFYCRPACWHSWNAAKRALALGCPKVAWYPEGTDGWAAAGLPLEKRTPEPRPDVSEAQ
ncbi:MAG: PQQ-dependent catabolism-associated CXXCW motif protein [Alphaproteobacteria bacterium]|nr:PQQ-dependent catabolism-associated CXXCW motif protein [Alphaproteobacteria bacterium]